MQIRQVMGLLAALAVVGLGPLAFGQSSASSQSGATAGAPADQAAAARKTAAVRSGTKIDAALESSVDARTAKPGDRVEARVLKDVRQDGRVVVHKGDRLVGKVTDAKSAATSGAGAQIGVAFDRVEGASGEMRMNTVLTSIFAANSQSAAGMGDTDPMMEPMPAAMGGSAVRSRGGLLGGATSTVAGAAGGAEGSVAGGAGTAVVRSGAALGTAAGSNAGAGANAGLATPARAIHIQSSAVAANQTSINSVLSTRHGDLRLESGTRMQFRVAASSTRASR